MVDIPEQELQVLRGAKALHDKLLSGKTRQRQEALIKELYPDTPTLDDITEPTRKEVAELRKEFKDYIEGEKGRKLDTKLEADIAYLKETEDFTDEGIDRLKKLMIEREIPSIRDAAVLWNHAHPPKPQEVSIMAPSDWGIGRKTEDPDLKLLFEDEDAWADKEARKAWSEETAKKGQIIT
jgi:hypothetical protein